MDIVIWVLIGSVLGWAAYAYMSYNQERGALVSIVIGAFGGFVGGNVVAPTFNAGAPPGSNLAAAAFFAAAVAAALLAAGNLIHKRWGV